jgi:hypothetical protein
MSTTSTSASQPSAAPWWAFGHVWMVIAGPAVVVVASFITLYLALTSPNTVLESEPSPQVQHGSAMDASLAPAMLARNHAATGVVPVKP